MGGGAKKERDELDISICMMNNILLELYPYHFLFV